MDECRSERGVVYIGESWQNYRLVSGTNYMYSMKQRKTFKLFWDANIHSCIKNGLYFREQTQN